MKLKIRNEIFDLPKTAGVHYEPLTNSTHLIFEINKEYEKLFETIFQRLNIDRWEHDLGIVFGAWQIFCDGDKWPEGIEIID